MWNAKKAKVTKQTIDLWSTEVKIRQECVPNLSQDGGDCSAGKETYIVTVLLSVGW